MNRFWNKVKKTDSCWLWQGGQYLNGYGAVRGTDQKQTSAHRLAWQLVNGEIPEGYNVCHTCDNRLCVNPEHLWLGTQSENIQDMYHKGRGNFAGRTQQGEKNNGSKLTEDIVRQIKTLASAGTRQADIMRITGATRANVWAIVHNKSWSHIK
jgi:hypothetical protein